MVVPTSCIIMICLAVLPLDMGMTIAPSFVAPWCAPMPPVNRPYPYATCTISSAVALAAPIVRAIISDQFSKSFRV